METEQIQEEYTLDVDQAYTQMNTDVTFISQLCVHVHIQVLSAIFVHLMTFFFFFLPNDFLKQVGSLAEFPCFRKAGSNSLLHSKGK